MSIHKCERLSELRSGQRAEKRDRGFGAPTDSYVCLVVGREGFSTGRVHGDVRPPPVGGELGFYPKGMGIRNFNVMPLRP